MKQLTEHEISKLSRIERYAYYEKLRTFNWSAKSLEEKESQVLNDISFYITRRDFGSLTLEEEIDVITDKTISNNIYTLNRESGISDYIQVVRQEKERFTFFCRTNSPFSQWHICNFTGATFLIEGVGGYDELKKKELMDNYFPLDIQNYNSSEQFMMYHKAMIFFDRETAHKIMSTNDVRKIKELGRMVKNFNQEIWGYYRSKIVYEGNKAKFTQNKVLKAALLSTKGTSMVETSIDDSLWSIGLSEHNQLAQNRSTWKGKNLMGEILTRIRIEMTGEY